MWIEQKAIQEMYPAKMCHEHETQPTKYNKQVHEVENSKYKKSTKITLWINNYSKTRL